MTVFWFMSAYNSWYQLKNRIRNLEKQLAEKIDAKNLLIQMFAAFFRASLLLEFDRSRVESIKSISLLSWPLLFTCSTLWRGCVCKRLSPCSLQCRCSKCLVKDFNLNKIRCSHVSNNVLNLYSVRAAVVMLKEHTGVAEARLNSIHENYVAAKKLQNAHCSRKRSRWSPVEYVGSPSLWRWTAPNFASLQTPCTDRQTFQETV